ncbi:MAG: filamentous hemagglutinin N-terminal domain-containing protein [Xenococcaceae cyanobacterium MO_167.B27]|nr:filamentous hemagglutinin N-terminal domain-containing protein [Xenococcaceae cyanobacterium MO_167.B27]
MLSPINLLLRQLETRRNPKGLALCVIYFLCLANSLKATAQITPDATLPNNSVVIPNADIIQITEGTTVGNNLFHSFQEFSVLNGQTAFFDNGLTIENIFSRVTGGSVSNIEGIIRANGAANLFLINPNGIIFGENATLNIGGSFIGSTANSIQFSDGSFYSAVDPQAPPLLTINIPIGLQYGDDAGNILVQGIGNNTGFADPSANDFSLIKNFRPSGLQVESGNTIALVGGNIALDGGNLTAAEGHIELGGVREGLVKLANDNGIWTFDYQEVAGFQDIDLVNAASVEVSGNSSGTVNVRGQNIALADASAILANTSGDGTAGSITLKGAESVMITGVSQNEIPFVTYVSTDTTTGSTGAGADLTIDTSYLLVAGGAQVASAVFGSGEGGTLSVNAEQVELISGSPLAGPSGLFAPIVPGATGVGGDINIETDSLLVAGGAQAFTLSLSSGKAGDFNIKAQEIELNGTSPNGSPSALFSNTFADGDGGNLTIDTGDLAIANGADIGSTVSGLGTAGNINIKANTIELKGLASLEDPSQISASIDNNQATGVGGDINIETNSLTLTNGTKINSSVFGSGNGGNITIKAQEIDLTGFSTGENSPTAIFASVVPGATGNSGNLTITTDNLRVSEGAQIAVSTGGSGSAGNLMVTASDSIELMGNAIEAGGGSSGLFSSAVFGDGDGGNIALTTDKLTVKDGATISGSNFLTTNADVPPGLGEAGNIEINANSIELDGIDADTPASITAATFAGSGGNIVLNSNTLTATNGSQITAETLGNGAGGSIQITTENFNLNTGAMVSSGTVAGGDGGTISVTSNLLDISTQGKITTNSTGTGQAGNINIESDRIQSNQGLITATSEQTGGGDINLTTDFIQLQNNSLVSTSVLDSTGGGGNIAIDSDVVLAANNSDIRANAVLGSGGNINIDTEVIFTSPSSDIDASSEFGLDGVVEINNPDTEKQFGLTQLPDTITNPTQLITASCPVNRENVMAIVGKGGYPDNPQQSLRGQSVWQDLRLVAISEEVETNNSISNVERNNKKTSIVEAKGWMLNDKGNIELISYAPESIYQTFWQHSFKCGGF